METFIQAGICWFLLIYFIRNIVIPVIEFFVEKDVDEEITYEI